MIKVIYYTKLENQNQVLKLTRELKFLKKDYSSKVEVADACTRIIEKAYPGRYLILDGAYPTSPTEQKVFFIKNASVWNSKPQSYAGCERDDYRLGLPMEKVPIEYNKFLEVLKSIFNTNSNSNSKNNGKDQSQLQGEESPDSGCYEGSILHCRRNRSQLAAGRHCDQAGIEVQGTRARRGEIYLSTRRPAVLGSRLSDRGTQGLPQEGSQAPGGVGIPSYCSGIKNHPDLVDIKIRVLPSKEECTQIGDAYRAKDGTMFLATKFDGQLGLIFTMQ